MTRNPVISSMRLALTTTALGLAAVVAACGGGGGGGSPAAAIPAAVAPSAATSYAQGVVSGFGSVIVGGVRYDDSKAGVVDADDNPLPLTKLGLGSMVTVDAGPVDRSSSTAAATRFHLSDEVLGQVASVDTTAQTLVVLGQTVTVNASTVFASSITSGLTQALVGTVVEVHGTAGAAGQITATRIEAAAAASSYHLRGTVAALDTTAKTFSIGAASISYASLAAADVPGTLANGLIVRVKLNTVQSGSNWVATALRGDKRVPAGSGAGSTDTHIEGAITVFTSSAAFEIGGVKVDASAATFPDGSAGIVPGARVEVTGTTNASGTLVAAKVELDDKPSAGGKRPLELHGALTALDTSAKTFLLRTVTVSYSGTVAYTNGTAAALATSQARGKNVDVYGVLSSDRKQLEASRIDFK